MSPGDNDHVEQPAPWGTDEAHDSNTQQRTTASGSRAATAQPHGDEPIVHVPPDDLAALAIDPENTDGDARVHVDWCVRCQREVETLRRVTERARRAAPSEASLPPPEDVWDRVVRELSESGDLAPPAAYEASEWSGRAQRTDGSERSERAETTRSPARWQGFALAAALVVVAILAAAVLLPLTGPADEGTVVAMADLQPLPDVQDLEAVEPADATLVRDGDEQTLRIEDLQLPETDGFYELWLLTEDGDQLVSLGPISEATREQIPQSVDATRFSIVDISVEPTDGDPSHSGASVLRGALDLDV